MSDAYDAFLATLAARPGGANPVALYHAVRNFRYASTGNRDPEEVLRSGAGACTAKHILLRDLLRRTGVAAQVAIVEGDFAAGLPRGSHVPEILRELAAEGPVEDFHNYVIADLGGRSVRLDATWHDRVAEAGFATNRDWHGEGDTLLAVAPKQDFGAVENVPALKERLIAGMDRAARERRALFLALLTRWIATLDTSVGRNDEQQSKSCLHRDRRGDDRNHRRDL